MVVRVEEVLLEFAVAGNVNLCDAMRGHRVDVGKRVETVVLRRDINIVDVEQNAAVGAFDDFGQELPLRHFGDVKLGVAGDVFDDHRHFREVLHLANLLRRHLDCFPGVRHGQQVVGVAAIHRAPAKMVAEPRSFGAARELLEPLQVLTAERIGRAEIHRHAVLHDFVLFENLVEHFERTAAIDHIVFRDDLEPVDDRVTAEDVLVVGNAQTDADAVIGKAVEAVCGHLRTSDEDGNAKGPRVARPFLVGWN